MKIFKFLIPGLVLVLSLYEGYCQSAPKEYKLPPFEKFTLSNGLTIYLMEQHEVPIISISAVMPAGAIYDGTRSGLASLTATALQFGTKSYTKQQIEEELDFLGAELNTFAAKESAGLAAKFASKDQDKVMPIIKEVLVNPVFNAEEFTKEKKRVLVGLEQAKESPRAVIGAYWDKLIFGEHVYGNPVSGTPSAIEKLTVGDLYSFYKDNYTATGSAIAIVGDFNAKDMKKKASRLFGEWKKGVKKMSEEALKPLSPPQTPRVLLVNKDDARETTFFIGGLAVSRNNHDFVAIDVVNTVFGGRFTSMLNDELRVNSGLTYGASSRFSPLKYSGSFFVTTFTANETTEAAISKAIEVLNNLHSNGISDEMLTSAKNYVKGTFPPRYETSGQLSGLLTSMFWYGYDESYINTFESKVNILTKGKVDEVIAKYFPKTNLQFVLIGKSSEIKGIAEKLGAVTEKQIKADGF